MNTIYVSDARAAMPLVPDESVDMIYMDPPYNTGHKFAGYTDQYAEQEWLDLIASTVSESHRVLQQTGSVWVHLDDSRMHRARCIMDDIFGAENYVGTIAWEKKNRASFLHAQLASVMDYVLVYAKDRTLLPPLTSGTTSAPGKRIPVHHNGNPVSEIEFPAGSVSFNLADGPVEAGAMNTASVASDLLDDFTIEGGVNREAFRMTGPFRYSSKTVGEMAVAADGEPAFIAPRLPLRPSYLSRVAVDKPMTDLQSFRTNGAPTNEDARAESEKLFGIAFDTPKPEGLMARFIEAATKAGDTVLDPFSGSGTTVAVARKLGRSFVGIENNPATVQMMIEPRLAGIDAGTDPLELKPVKSAHGWSVKTVEELSIR